MLNYFLILNLLVSFTISWNTNTCAWAVIGNKQPNSTLDCLGDQTFSAQNCCYMKLKIYGQTIFNMCYLLPKYIVNTGTKEELTKALQNDIGGLFEIMDLTCKTDPPTIPDKRNIIFGNTCAFDTLKYNEPKEINDCVKDIDPANSSKCCYLESTWNGVLLKSCNNYSKISDYDINSLKDEFNNMGGKLNKYECKALDETPVPTDSKNNDKNYLTYSLYVILVIVLIMF
jgi:hypothetical protein